MAARGPRAALPACLAMLLVAVALGGAAPLRAGLDPISSWWDGGSSAAISAPASASDSPGNHEEAGWRDGGSRQGAALGASGGAREGVDENGASYRLGEVLVRLSGSISLHDAENRLNELGIIENVSLQQDNGALGWRTLELRDGLGVSEAIEKLVDSGAVEEAQPNFVYRLLEGGSSVHGDLGRPATSLQLAAAQVQGDSEPWYLQAIGAAGAWDALEPSGGVTVAVVDSGCDVNHEDIKPFVKAGFAHNVVTGSSDVTDAIGHGTMVAGIVARVLGSPSGASGHADLGIMPIKVMNGDTTDTQALVKAYDYILKNARARNVRVVSMSLGGMQASLGVSDVATLYAIDVAARNGILSVFAGGNEERTMPYYCFPCDFAENGLGVINLKQTDESVAPTKSTVAKHGSSNYNVAGGRTKDVSAPGTDILAAVEGGGRGAATGTSMATPVVAGVAALVFAQNPSLTAGEAKSVICTAADDLVYTAFSPHATFGFDAATGYGLVRADRAVEGALDAYITGDDSIRVGSSTLLGVAQSGTWSFSSDDPSVVSVDALTGRAYGVSPGEAIVSATNGADTFKRTIVAYEANMDGASSVGVGKSITLSATSRPVAAWTYSSSDSSVATVGQFSGRVVGKRVGSATIMAVHSVLPQLRLTRVINVKKGANPLVAKAKTVKLKASDVKRKARKVKAKKAFTVKSAQGAVRFKVVKYDRVAKKKIKVGKRGKVTVARGLARGTYTMKVRIRAAGNGDYKPKSKTVTLKIKIR